MRDPGDLGALAAAACRDDRASAPDSRPGGTRGQSPNPGRSRSARAAGLPSRASSPKSDLGPAKRDPIDGLNRQSAEDGLGVRGQRGRPLVGVLRFSPARPVGRDISVGAFPEGNRAGGVQSGLCLRGLAPFDGIDTSRRSLRACIALPRASDKVVSGSGPKPISRALPFSMKR